jgi:hypothetical protein
MNEARAIKRSPPLLPHDAWQAERRNAVAVLSRQIAQASRACRWDLEDALRTARRDVQEQLRTMAAVEITLSVDMRQPREAAPLRLAA